ncbi:MAG: DUF4388 domain-containing protein [Chitinispirillia bacterium]|jgi:hypothetical protein
MSIFPIIIITSGLLAGIGVSLLISSLIKKKEDKSDNDYNSKNTTFVFSGNLKQTNLLETVQFLELGRREGVLHIYCGRRKGYLTFSKGRVIDAFYRNYTGREAVIQMFEIDEGDFYFEPKKIYQPRIIMDSIINLAFEWDERKEKK